MQRMSQEKETEVKTPFQSKMDELRAPDPYSIAFDEVVQQTGVSAPTVYRWLSGESIPDKLQRKVIAEILKTDVKELWPDERL